MHLLTGTTLRTLIWNLSGEVTAPKSKISYPLERLINTLQSQETSKLMLRNLVRMLFPPRLQVNLILLSDNLTQG